MTKELFLLDVANQLKITQGCKESKEEWYCRVIYSAIGRMSLTALLSNDTEEKVSVTYFKRNIKTLQKNYLSLFSELKMHFCDLSENIYDLYYNNGYFYHSSNWIYPAIEKRIDIGMCSLIRGDYWSDDISMSGLGLYRLLKIKTSDCIDVGKEFLFQTDYASYVRNLLKKANWSEFNVDNDVEYLQLDGFWQKGYWKKNPDILDRVSLLRIGQTGNYLYYLYRYNNGKCLVSKLPDSLVQKFEYISIACGLLVLNDKWPLYESQQLGDNVRIKLRYFLPPDVMNFFMLYSWPCFTSFDSSIYIEYSKFERVMTKNMYDVFESIMIKIGLKRM